MVPATSEHPHDLPIPATIDQFNWEIVEFVLKWAHYGGPKDEDTMPLFGMDTPRLMERFDDILHRLCSDSRLVMTPRQHQLFARARELHSSAPTKHVCRTQKVGNSALDLTADGGRWIQHHGLWRWQSSPIA